MCIRDSSNTGALAINKQADLLVLDDSLLRLFAHDDKHLLDSIIFASQRNPILDVMVNGQWVIRDTEHVLGQESADSFANLLAKLSA